jgi:hypothetical protein
MADAVRDPDPACRSEMGPPGGARSAAEMGSQSGLPVGEEPTGGTRSAAEIGPDSSVRGPVRIKTGPLEKTSGPRISGGVCTRSELRAPSTLCSDPDGAGPE